MGLAMSNQVRPGAASAARDGAVLALVVLGALRGIAWAEDPAAPPGRDTGGEVAPISAQAEAPPDWLARGELTGDCGGAGPSLRDSTVTKLLDAAARAVARKDVR
jgi:hypothetical protein